MGFLVPRRSKLEIGLDLLCSQDMNEVHVDSTAKRLQCFVVNTKDQQRPVVSGLLTKVACRCKDAPLSGAQMASSLNGP